jgi:hypothetical protein
MNDETARISYPNQNAEYVAPQTACDCGFLACPTCYPAADEVGSSYQPVVPVSSADYVAVPFAAKYLIQQAIWDEFRRGDNEWTTWTDAVALAEAVANRLGQEGYVVRYEVSPDE